MLTAALTDVLAGAWAEELGDRERVVVVPHGVLAGLPFHLLEPAGGPLAATHVVSYAPSAAHVPRLAGGGPPAGASFVLGDPAYGPATGLPALPGSAVEAWAVGAALGNDRVHIGDTATRAAVLAHAPGAAVLHLGTHGLLDDRFPNRARLRLGR